jgi:hypothetical protein
MIDAANYVLNCEAAKKSGDEFLFWRHLHTIVSGSSDTILHTFNRCCLVSTTEQREKALKLTIEDNKK